VQVAGRKPEFIVDTQDVLSGYFKVDPSGVIIRQNDVFSTPQV
jgi:hypothetical protein